MCTARACASVDPLGNENGRRKEIGEMSGRVKARVLRVLDGDTVICASEVNREEFGELTVGFPFTVRMKAIDAPEQGQRAFGWCLGQAKRYLEKKVFWVEPGRVDRYGRIVAELFDVDEVSASEVFVAAGIAVVYRQYAQGRLELLEMEREAREARRGLWRWPECSKPWEYRNARRRKYQDPRGKWTERGRP